MQKIKVGLIGWGTVGSGVIKVLKSNGALIARRLGARLVLSRIADIDLKRDRGISVSRGLLTRQASVILRDPEIKIVIELIGGLAPAEDYIVRALQAGKHVVTANKALLALKGKKLFRLAEKQRRSIFFEASVGGGIPVIRALREGLAGNKIKSVLGIINGTSNYILSRMTRDDKSLAAALSEAQAKGYAEPDPTLDLNGVDSAHKLVILASLAFGSWIDLRKVSVEGIEKITREDILYTGDLGYIIKPLAIAKQNPSGIEMRVHPTLIPRHHPLAAVHGVFNAIYVESDYSGENIFYGRGAGGGPAASAVVADLVEAGREILSRNSRRLTSFPDGTRLKVFPFGETEGPHYLRIPVVDRPKVLAKISAILGSLGISIASVIQRGRRKKGVVPIILMTHRAKEKALQNAVRRLNRLDVVKGRCLRLRVEE